MKRRNDSRDLSDPSRSHEAAPKPRRKMKIRPSTLRIIGGDMRGRLVHYHGAAFTRPMKDSVRENLFNILGRTVRGAICFDLFAGTGALGFEAISRGAVAAVAVEQSRVAAAQIRETAQSLGVSDRLTVHIGDAFRWSNRLLAPPEDDVPWIVMLCPPYALWDDSLESLNQIVNLSLQNAPPGSLVVVETDKRFDASLLPAGEWDLRHYGGTQLAIIEAANRCGLEL